MSRSVRRAAVAALLLCALAVAVPAFLLLRPYDPGAPRPFDPDLQAIMESRIPPDAGLVFLGDSITHRWVFRPDQWQRLAAYRPANLGINSDRVCNVLWRVTEHHELDGIRPSAVVVLIGTNDLGEADRPFYKPRTPSDAAIAGAVGKLLAEVRARQPQARIILMALLPRDGMVGRVRSLNARLETLAAERHADWLDLGPKLAGPDGAMRREFTVDGLHLTDAGYRVWADALLELLHG